MDTEYYKIPESDLPLFFLQEGNERIEPIQLYDGSWIISSKALSLKFIPVDVLEKAAKYDYWKEVDSLWFKATYDSIQDLTADEELTEEEVEIIKDSVKPMAPSNKRPTDPKETKDETILDSIKSAWNSLFP